MSLSEYSRGGHEDEARDADAEEVVAGQQGDVGEGALEVEGEGEGVGGEQRGESRGDNGEDAEDRADDVALVEGPVLDITHISVSPFSCWWATLNVATNERWWKSIPTDPSDPHWAAARE